MPHRAESPRSWRTVAAIPSLASLPAYVDLEERQALLDAVDDAPWLSDLRRRVQHYS